MQGYDAPDLPSQDDALPQLRRQQALTAGAQQSSRIVIVMHELFGKEERGPARKTSIKIAKTAVTAKPSKSEFSSGWLLLKLYVAGAAHALE